jgi:hypothetical protein
MSAVSPAALADELRQLQLAIDALTIRKVQVFLYETAQEARNVDLARQLRALADCLDAMDHELEPTKDNV